MPVVINGSTGISGVSTVNLANGSVTQNILANGVSTTGPTFFAYPATTQSVGSGTFTKVNLGATGWNVLNNFSTANSRFTPTVAGYYQFIGSVYFPYNGQVEIVLAVAINGSNLYLNDLITPIGRQCVGTRMVYMNGTTDYAELYAYSSGGGTITADSNINFFQAFLARAA